VPVVAVERVPSSTEVPGMQIAIVGLSRTGANKVRRLLRGGYGCSVFGVSPQAVERLVGEGARGAGPA
jgi:6-phosphogluconate dehydrogenase